MKKSTFIIVTTLKFSTISALMFSCLSSAKETLPQDKPGYEQARDLGVKPPEGADVPFDGTLKSIEENWEMWPKKEMPISWLVVKSPTDDGMVLKTHGGNTWGSMDLITKKKYKNYEGHIEFVLMGDRGDEKAEGYANSGVYMQNRHELQIESPKSKIDIEDPFNWKIDPHGIGAICMEHVPSQNAWRPNGQWQSFHFIFTAGKWDGEKLVEPARVTVWWNGLKVHDNVPVEKANGGVKNGPSDEGIKLQEHGQDVRYRNIWIKPISL